MTASDGFNTDLAEHSLKILRVFRCADLARLLDEPFALGLSIWRRSFTCWHGDHLSESCKGRRVLRAVCGGNALSIPEIVAIRAMPSSAEPPLTTNTSRPKY